MLGKSLEVECPCAHALDKSIVALVYGLVMFIIMILNSKYDDIECTCSRGEGDCLTKMKIHQEEAHPFFKVLTSYTCTVKNIKKGCIPK